MVLWCGNCGSLPSSNEIESPDTPTPSPGERVGYKTVPSQGDSARREARHVVPIPGSDAQKDFHSRKDAIYDGPWNPHPMDCIYEVGRH